MDAAAQAVPAFGELFVALLTTRTETRGTPVAMTAEAAALCADIFAAQDLSDFYEGVDLALDDQRLERAIVVAASSSSVTTAHGSVGALIKSILGDGVAVESRRIDAALPRMAATKAAIAVRVAAPSVPAVSPLHFLRLFLTAGAPVELGRSALKMARSIVGALLCDYVAATDNHPAPWLAKAAAGMIADGLESGIEMITMLVGLYDQAQTEPKVIPEPMRTWLTRLAAERATVKLHLQTVDATGKPLFLAPEADQVDD